MTFVAPTTFVLIASIGLYSQAGTCFSAAAWTTTSTPLNGALQPVAVAHVADEVAEWPPVGVGETGPHLVLLQLVAAEDDQLLGLLLPGKDFDEFAAEGAGAAGHENNAVFPGEIHV